MQIDLIAKLKTTDEFLRNFNEADINKNFHNKSLLFFSLSNNDLCSRYKITNYLLDKGADATGLNEENENLLHILLSRTNHDLEQTIVLCKRLIENGVSINQLDNKKRLPLQYLINMKYTDVELEPLYAIWFSQTYVDVRTKNEWGISPIELAEKMPYRNIILERMKEISARQGV